MKTLKSGTSEEDKVKFLQEAAIMGQFSHINVIKMYGVVTVGEPVCKFTHTEVVLTDLRKPLNYFFNEVPLH